MQNIKQQISDLKYQTGFIINQIKQLEQQVNKPKIEVGDWFKSKVDDEMTYWGKIIEKNEIDVTFFGINRMGWTKQQYSKNSSIVCRNMVKLSNEGVTEFLTNYFDKLYEGVEKVDRSGLDIDKRINPDITNLVEGYKPEFRDNGFCYRGVYVMDSKGNTAKPVVEAKIETTYTIEEIETIAQQYAFFCLGKHGVSKFERDVKGFKEWFNNNYFLTGEELVRK